MEYKVVSGPYEFVLEVVQECLDAGWQLAGGISISTDPDADREYTNIYAQALTKVK